ncbi:MAG: hypothetical protein QME94_04255, partial [Anaerolineae bacterium]|nr:hypothetical protein [Anaerolineae bacterium]
FHDSAMFVVYGTTLVWAAIVNLTAGSARWAAFAVLQGYLVVRVFRQFFRFRRVERDYPALAPEGLAWDAAAGRAQRLFPWLGCLLGLLTLGGACGLFMALILVGEGASATALDLLVEGVVNLGVLALAVSLGSLLAGYRYRFLAALGVASSALVIIPTLILVFVAAFSRGVNPQFP